MPAGRGIGVEIPAGAEAEAETLGIIPRDMMARVTCPKAALLTPPYLCETGLIGIMTAGDATETVALVKVLVSHQKSQSLRRRKRERYYYVTCNLHINVVYLLFIVS